MEDIEHIQPYNDEEVVAALHKLARHPALPVISKYIFPEFPVSTLKEMLNGIKGVDDFQYTIVAKAVSVIVGRSSSGFTYEGIENFHKLGGNGRFLAISNHRDIVLDPALTQWMLMLNNIPLTEICVGSNLLANGVVEALLRSNRMITVIRGISAREMYLSSQILSKFVRSEITSGKSSVWIAQREGRTKNGLDITEQGLLKMFDMSGEGDFKSNFRELNIIPMSISYEYEPCDFRKAREIYIKETTGTYKKKGNEDMHSILTGIRQWKGGIHLSVGEPLTEEEIDKASWYEKNDRYQAIRRILDERIISGYKLWKTNYMAYDMMTGGCRFSDKYSAEDLENFNRYIEHKLQRLEKRYDKERVRDIFLHIYGNPIVSKEG
ncbi:MAG: 1-acyl-sn-glycerol-3-phosphate acyltransferase [Bacteroidales bacterium]|nr:1-acyl-sn-glycerol-3-phosphate acyltransferase [Bacteroidales bacterium]